MACVVFVQLAMQSQHVVRRPHKRHADDIDMWRKNRDIIDIDGRESRDLDIGLRKVDALFRRKLAALRQGMGDFYNDALFLAGEDAAADLAVVEPNGLARLGRQENFGQRARYGCAFQQFLAGLVVLGRLAHFAVGDDFQFISNAKHDGTKYFRQR